MESDKRSEERKLSLKELSDMISRQGFGRVSIEELRTEFGIEEDSMSFLDFLAKLITDERS